MHLSDKALLVHLAISQWTARKLDKKATTELINLHGASMDSGRFNKSLLPTCNTLQRVHSETSIIRKDFYRNTLPWGIEGTFILPSANYLNFMTEFRKKRGQWESLVTDFLNEYEQAHLDAQHLLGSLYNPKDYPTLDELTHKFNMGITVLPVPSKGDFRVELSDVEQDSVEKAIEERVAASSRAAMDDVWQRLYDKVTWLTDRLAKPENTFKDATYKDAQETCALLTRLNFTGDPNLEQLRRDAEAKLFNHHPESLRNDPDLQRDVLAEANEISRKMAAFMGGLS